jgi:hypothetical protein
MCWMDKKGIIMLNYLYALLPVRKSEKIVAYLM